MIDYYDTWLLISALSRLIELCILGLIAHRVWQIKLKLK
jgi:hypothetical protein